MNKTSAKIVLHVFCDIAITWFYSSGLLSECSRIAPKGVFFSIQPEVMPNIVNNILREKLLILRHLWLGKMHSSQHCFERLNTKKVKTDKKMLSRIRNSPLSWSSFIGDSLVHQELKVKFLVLQLLSQKWAQANCFIFVVHCPIVKLKIITITLNP